MAVHDPPTSTSARKPVSAYSVWFGFFYGAADVSHGSPRPSGKLAAVIRFDIREDRKYEEEEKQGDGLEKWRDESETRDG